MKRVIKTLVLMAILLLLPAKARADMGAPEELIEVIIAVISTGFLTELREKSGLWILISRI